MTKYHVNIPLVTEITSDKARQRAILTIGKVPSAIKFTEMHKSTRGQIVGGKTPGNTENLMN